MIIIAGRLYVDAEARDAYLAGCRKVVETARSAPGCLDFALSADMLEPDRINVYERWESGEDVERFRGDGPGPEQAARIRDAEVLRYVISAVEAP
ncbi:putative quinol monooxygenase [Actinomadura citrea]|uniref:Quinol monooxygenase YgiN n=1 Tax=Actinomadura citrea TaxID=46158 RepID=A0A7Y9G5H3_9ACTN|nr:antibiotic biosynthesis monooxygenase family protein [Actinomadura citrea]NYE10244.1 quinol monooxygenase YgiN [Actinomadura citrea]GGT71075.1 antibiotic biosynthesis monooxygenase [Actinomadura citrea]